MRIALECASHIWGGFENFLARLTRGLEQEGMEPWLVCLEPGPEWGRWKALGRPTICLPDRGPEGRQQLVQQLRREAIALCQSQGYDPSFAMAARQAGCAHVWRIKGHIDLCLCEDEEQKQRLLALGCALADVVVCPSHFLAGQFQPFHHHDLRVIANGLDLSLFASPPLPRPARRRVGSIGHLVTSKNYETFLQAAALLRERFPEVEFLIYGQPGEGGGYAQQLAREVDRLGLPKDLLRGPYREPLPEVLASFEVLAFPFLDEGFANATVEAMAMGKPVVAVRSGVQAEHIEDGVDGLLVPPRHPEAMATAIAALLDNPSWAQQLGQQARAKAQREWSLQRCASRYAALYRELASPR